MRAALFQFQPALGDTRANLDVIERLGRDVDAGLWVLPELCLSGYELSDPGQARDCSQRADADDPAFARLVLNPALRPMRMDDRWLDSFSALQKKQWVEFAKRLEAFFHAGGSTAAILEPEPEASPE